MTYTARLILIMITTFNILFLCACSNNTRYIIDNDLHNKYLAAKNNLKHNNYKKAIKELESLNKQYLHISPYNNQIHFDLIYAYYKIMDFPLIFQTINNFIQSNPNHPNTDYPLYMKGLSNMELDNNYYWSNKLSFDHSEKNILYAHKAFHNFVQLIDQYPNSQYTPDAHKRLTYLKNRIAEHELSIIKYYNKKEAYIAVINRSEDMLHYFPDTKATYNALHYMYTAYQKLNLIDQSNKVMTIINHNNK